MNRLFLIGNGFDLAHGMKSKYSDFLNWLLDGILTNLQNGKGYNDGDISIEFSKAIRNMLVIAKVNGSEVTRKSLMEKLGMVSAKFIPHGNETHTNITFKNENFILSKLLPDLSKSNWVDIENVYYNLLLRCVKHIDDPREQLSISILNRNLNFLITKLEEYLTPHDNVHEDTRFAKIFNASFNEKHFKKTDRKYLNSFQEAMAVSFNFTETHKLYLTNGGTLKNEVGSANVEEINIHGKLNDVNNPIIFGFGDEMDLRYKTIEELNDNNYLEFIKSHRYLRTSNYKKLVNFIELGPFQTIILGHSCGLSDRVMLNMIFEHTNCKSILLYYHQFGEGYGGTNFSELVKNISRHFNKKDLMRQKVVEYELSERLPQL